MTALLRARRDVARVRAPASAGRPAVFLSSFWFGALSPGQIAFLVMVFAASAAPACRVPAAWSQVRVIRRLAQVPDHVLFS